MNEVFERFAESESPTRILAQPQVISEARQRAA
jgi:hypothetical protein